MADSTSNAEIVVPGSVASSAWSEVVQAAVVDAQALPEKVEFVHNLTNAMEDLCKKHGGPTQFLEHMLSATEDRVALAQWMKTTFPMVDDTTYTLTRTLPAVDEEELGNLAPLTVPVACLGWERWVSLKSPIGETVCMELTHEIVTDGFITMGDPLLVLQPEEGVSAPYGTIDGTTDGLGLFSLGYVKGHARVTTITAMLLLIHADDIDLKTKHPKLFTSLLRVKVHHRPQSSRVQWGLKNCKLSCRGAIRRAPNVITFASMMFKIYKGGNQQYAEFVKEWNRTSARTHQLIGSRAVTLKLLLESAPTSVIEHLVNHVAKFTWDRCAFSDDALSSKRIYPHFQFRCTVSKAWQNRMKTSEASMQLMLDRVCYEHEHALPHMRRKVAKTTLEDLACQAAVVLAIERELQANSNVPPSQLEAWAIQWAHGDVMVGVEVSAALLAKDDTFNPMEMPSVKAILAAHALGAPVTNPALQEAQNNLKEDEYQLCLKQLKYDVKVIRTWMQKYRDHEAAIFHKKQDWALARKAKAKQAADRFFALYCDVIVWESVDKVLIKIQDFIKDKAKTHRRDASECIMLGMLNWISPSLTSSQQQQANYLFGGGGSRL